MSMHGCFLLSNPKRLSTHQMEINESQHDSNFRKSKQHIKNNNKDQVRTEVRKANLVRCLAKNIHGFVITPRDKSPISGTLN